MLHYAWQETFNFTTVYNFRHSRGLMRDLTEPD